MQAVNSEDWTRGGVQLCVAHVIGGASLTLERMQPAASPWLHGASQRHSEAELLARELPLPPALLAIAIVQAAPAAQEGQLRQAPDGAGEGGIVVGVAASFIRSASAGVGALGKGIRHQLRPVGIAGQRHRVADRYVQRLGSCDGHVEAPRVGQE